MDSLPEDLELTSHLTNLEFQGFTMVLDAIPAPMLAKVQKAFRACVDTAVPGTLEFGSPLHKTPAAVVDDDGVVEITQPYEHYTILQDMLELPRPMAVLEAALGQPVRSMRHVHGDRVTHRLGVDEHFSKNAGAHLFYSTNGHVLPPKVDCDLRWHADGDFLRYTFLIEDVGERVCPMLCSCELSLLLKWSYVYATHSPQRRRDSICARNA